MILVDSSIWIAYLSSGEDPVAEQFEELLEQGEVLCTTGLVLTEVLQGIRRTEQFMETRKILERFPCIDVTVDQHILGAQLYREARQQGVTPRSTIDCLLCAICLDLCIPLLHHDRDFLRLASLFGLHELSTGLS